MTPTNKELCDLDRLRGKAHAVLDSMRDFTADYQSASDLDLAIGEELYDAYGEFSQVVLALDSKRFRMDMDEKPERHIL